MSIHSLGKTPASRRISSSVQNRSVTMAVYQELLDEILHLDLKPGEPLSENMLADRLGVSRTPIREALVLLETKQLVDIYPQRKTIVSPIRIRHLRRSQFIRESLEIGMIKRVLEAGKQAELYERLSQEIVTQRACVDRGDVKAFYVSDEEFHRNIVHYAGIAELWEDISNAKLHMDRARQFTLAHLDSMPELIEQHQAIATAIRSGDTMIVETAVKEHLRRIFMHLQEIANQFSE